MTKIVVLAAIAIACQLFVGAFTYGYVREVQAEDDCAYNTYSVTSVAGHLFCVGEP